MITALLFCLLAAFGGRLALLAQNRFQIGEMDATGYKENVPEAEFRMARAKSGRRATPSLASCSTIALGSKVVVGV